MWRITAAADMNKLDAFHRKRMRKIQKVFWPNQISNEELNRRTSTLPLSVKIRIRRWRCIGQVLRRDNNSIARTALTWALEGKRRLGRPRTTWRRSVERESGRRWDGSHGGPQQRLRETEMGGGHFWMALGVLQKKQNNHCKSIKTFTKLSLYVQIIQTSSFQSFFFSFQNLKPQRSHVTVCVYWKV